MSACKHKSTVPEVVLDYCIDEKLTVAEGLVAYLEDHFAVVDSALRDLKRNITKDLYAEELHEQNIEQREVDDIESFLKFLEDQAADDNEN